MSLFVALILGLIAWYVLKVVIAVMNARNRAQDFFNQFNQASANARRQQSRPGGWSDTSASRRKKIDSNVGEYVAFEEVDESTEQRHTTAEASSADRNDKDNGRESQITDAEWEDI